MDRLDRETWSKQRAKIESRSIGKCFPRLWAYWALNDLLTPLEEFDHMVDPYKPLQGRISATEKQCAMRYPEMSKFELGDRLAAIVVKPLPKIQYQQNLAETLSSKTTC